MSEAVDHSLFEEAEKLITGDRHDDYGLAERNFSRIAKAWEAITDRPYTNAEVGLMMVVLKAVRHAHGYKRDNIVDVMGYAGLTEEVDERKGSLGPPKGLTMKEVTALKVPPTAPTVTLASVYDKQQRWVNNNACPENYHVVSSSTGPRCRIDSFSDPS